MVPLVDVAVDKPTVEAEMAVAAAGGVEAVDDGPETVILRSLYLMIPCPPLPPWHMALMSRAYRQTSV